MIKHGSGAERSIAFVDDAHTFGGAQIAMGWAIRAILRHSPLSVVCVCTVQTWDRIRPLAEENARLRFVECAPALRLNIFTFPLRLRAIHKVLTPLLREGIREWWLNLAGIEFCLAPLIILKQHGIHPSSWLHNSETFRFYNAKGSLLRKLISCIRDASAERFVFSLYSQIMTPSHATENALKRRLRPGQQPSTGFLYPIVGVQLEEARQNSHTDGSVQLWMIGRVEYVSKNNTVAVEIVKRLRGQNVSAFLSVVGDGPDLRHLKATVRDSGVSDFVSFRGWQSNPWKLIPNEAIVLLPSHSEGMPLVATEAMMHGVRLVTSPLAVFHEGVPHEMVARAFSTEAFTEKIAEVSSMDDGRVRALYSEALKKFTETAFVTKFESLLPVGYAAECVPEAGRVGGGLV
jgi:glycosyltransferase involved in cell wall biosynthesis